MKSNILLLGQAVFIVGLLVEVVGVIADCWYPLRRRLPVSPLFLQSWGALIFFAGVAIVFAAQLWG